jgi:hypothetical protein
MHLLVIPKHSGSMFTHEKPEGMQPQNLDVDKKTV